MQRSSVSAARLRGRPIPDRTTRPDKMSDNRNMILAVILSGVILLAWQLFYYGPQTERQRAAQQAQQAELQKSAPKPADTTSPSNAAPQPGSTTAAPQAPAPAAAPVVSRDKAIADSPRVKIETPSLTGSIALKGA